MPEFTAEMRDSGNGEVLYRAQFMRRAGEVQVGARDGRFGGRMPREGVKIFEIKAAKIHRVVYAQYNIWDKFDPVTD